MALNLDSYFGIHAKALSLRDQRSSQLAMNITNADTPNYKAKDMDFKEALSQAQTSTSAGKLQLSSPNHLSANADISLTLKERKSKNDSLDGNTVDKDLETIEFSRNALNYQASLSFLDSKIKSMMLALRGE